MHRFVVGPDLTLSADQARQIRKVLRLEAGETITLLADGDEIEYRLDAVSASAVQGTVLARRPSQREPRVRLILALPLLRGEHSELVLESATQLGVSRFVPFVSTRSVARELNTQKRARWERIAREAAETSRRARVPGIAPLTRWADLFDELEGDLIVAWEEEPELRLAQAVPIGSDAVSLVIGPEGGLTAEEVEAARQAGAAIVSLGPRPLRAETAAIAAVAELAALLEVPQR